MELQPTTLCRGPVSHRRPSGESPPAGRRRAVASRRSRTAGRPLMLLPGAAIGGSVDRGQKVAGAENARKVGGVWRAPVGNHPIGRAPVLAEAQRMSASLVFAGERSIVVVENLACVARLRRVGASRAVQCYGKRSNQEVEQI